MAERAQKDGGGDGGGKAGKPVDAPSRLDRVRYYVDLFMSSSPASRFLGLFGISFVVVAVCAGLALLASPPDGDLSGNFLEAMWWALIRVVDSGGMAEDKGAAVRLVAVFATLCGVMVVALLIGLVSSAMAEKIESLRAGRSPVIDADHTLLLGFGDKAFPILRELREANSSKKQASIVVLTARSKQEVEDEIREGMGPMGTTRVVVRQGSPFSPADLRKVGAGRARAIIVLADSIASEDGEAEAAGDPDLAAIKTLLALRRVRGALVENHAVVELADARRAPVIQRLGGRGVEIVTMRETLARLMVQTARQAGLAGIYRTLLGFDGAEFYVKAFPELSGKPFGSVQPYLRGAIAVGVRRVTAGGERQVCLNPDAQLKIGAKDELVVLAEDDDSFGVDLQRPLNAKIFEPRPAPRSARQPEHVLLCGRRADMARLLVDFDAYAAPGSEVSWMPGDGEPPTLEGEGPLAFKNIKLLHRDGDPTDPDVVKAIVADRFESILLVADDRLKAEEADARTVIALLMLREGFAAALAGAPAGTRPPRIISEILDPRTKDLVTADEATDFVVSSEITSMLLAQVAEQRDVNLLYTDLFDPDGSEIYLKSVDRYAPVGAPVSFASVAAVARRYGEVALGCYRFGSAPLLNPSPETALVLQAGDKIVVLAEDESETLAVKAAA
jgi:voltage-gated potassium channel Kch